MVSKKNVQKSTAVSTTVGRLGQHRARDVEVVVLEAPAVVEGDHQASRKERLAAK